MGSYTAAECSAKIALYSAAIDAKLSGGAVMSSAGPAGDSLSFESLATLERQLALWKSRLAQANLESSNPTGISFAKVTNG